MRFRLPGVASATALLTAILLCAVAPAAQAATEDPLFVFVPAPPANVIEAPIPPPFGTINGACGVAVDSGGNFYVSDYYRHNVYIWEPNANYGGTNPRPTGATGYVGQLSNEDPLDGPCGLAIDAADHLYVNNYHRHVVRFGARPFFGVGTPFPLPSEDTAHHLPTGVAVDPVGERVYVDERTYVEVFDLSGTPILEGGEPLRIGVGSLGDAYGVAFSQFPGTLGRIYVPDATSETIRIYDPAINLADPVAEIDGTGTPEGKFVSLRDAAIAIDRVSGDVYVVDDLQPRHTEKPQAIVYVFDSTGAYKGHLKYKVGDARPVGLAVDNSPALTYPAGTQGRVYVTSGNTDSAAIYAYRPGAATTSPSKPSAFSLSTAIAGSGSVRSSSDESDCAGTCGSEVFSGLTVGLTATPASGSSFTGWSGSCSGDSQTCVVRMDEAASVGARFAPIETPQGVVPAGQAAGSPQQPVGSLKRQRRRARHRHHRRRSHHHKPGVAEAARVLTNRGTR